MTTEFRSPCPIASTLDIIGDRWTLIIIRDLLNGKKRFSEFLTSPEKITTSVLTTRLGALEANGLVAREIYQTKPKRYEYILADKGRQLVPILQAMCVWGNTFIDDTWIPPASFMQQKA